MSPIPSAKIVSQTSHLVAGKLKITEHFFDVPKDYSRPETGTIRIFARSAKKHDTTIVPEVSKDKDQLPWMCYLQGGPGMNCGPPQLYAQTHFALDRGYQILYLDQRGTGLSTPVTASTLQMRGDNAVQARYLKLYRADSIVRDCEAIRQALTADYPNDKKKWSIMGQSFGGFCAVSYLSFHPEGLREAFLFGGLQPLVKSPDEVYRRLYRKVAERNEAYYTKYPEDVDKVKKIMFYLKRFGDGKIKLPSEGALTRRRFQQLGIAFGGHGGLDAVHEIVLKASYDIEAFGHLTRGTLSSIDSASLMDDHILYALLHEPIYCEGNAPNWSAHRMMEQYPEFDLDRKDSPIFFTGEMIFPHMFEDYSELAKVQDVANRVASDADWSPLFDEGQLAKNKVPVYAASYVEDMYVDFDLAMETARKIKGCKVFTTNVMFHNSLRVKTDELLKQAFALRDDVVD
ncbi:putative proline iminopeptidase [Teratosphaeria destructans]|uniref:Proline iminopeptidase n=1 Tax=Teratosphaeria destructans TaxID=418781 RepID=A0A9W7SK87_9PEZI|nr:putative proline iminopeptidase [Teratosphaeria destructans]